MSSFVKVAKLGDIPPLGSRVIRKGDVKIAVFRTADDQVFALLDKCPHKGGPLSQGIVHGCRVTCPLHSMVVELASGQAVAPDEGHALTFPTKVEDGTILIDLSAIGAAAA
jgi:nitrite reductase (NADH) small subunit